MKQLSDLAPTFEDGFEDIQKQVKSMRRELAAVLMAQYPDREFILSQVDKLQGSLGADETQVNVVLHDRQITIVSKPGEIAVSVEVPSTSSLCIYTVAGDETLVISDIQSNEFMASHPCRSAWGSWVSAPIKVAGQSAGTVCVLDKEARVWTEEEAVQLEQIAQSISDAVNKWAGNESE